ncbi:MAG: bifunctional [glutamate--ammonia ligase]-adenylyl-L-tyrosine phosphorylase/[glutamate--ammonia-ligase] adenylyltransferase [Candidatus Hydrogenedentes bacterium]|nr:bifunctional [glutamate--ammonia ligase]-adenylyl-L-tyrosine phosphorylase/[glutamate--ammonia-ligase] adenylyltransferase [Candidatus Hydrogenedentota bacterium]
MEILEHIEFEDREAAQSCLDTIVGMGSDILVAPLLESLAESADPLKAIVGMTRFLERSFSIATETDMMVSSPRYLHMLTTLFSQGTLLSDILCRNPEYGAWLWTDALLDRARTRDEIVAEITRAFKSRSTFEERCVWMRRHARIEQLRIATREVFAHEPFNSIVADISALADAMLEAGYMAARDQLASRTGIPIADYNEEEVTFCILAMGKLGGGELNFSSDIDLLFLYSADGHTPKNAGQAMSTEEYFRKFGELFIKALSEQTAAGRVFRVDMRLRPFGKSGPIASSLENAVEYYSTYGRAWERQAMIKARPCAGDISLGNLFLEQVRPFVYPRYFDDATLEDIRGIKQQTEAIVAKKDHTEREVKLGRGGIRDIEFTVQMLQLLQGGRWPEIRTTNTLAAIRVLGEKQRISPFEAETLERNYIFLRHIEHRLQIEGGLQTHILPENKQELMLVARRLGYQDSNAFMNVYRERTAETRAILEQFLAVKGDGNLWVMELLDPGASCVTGMERLQNSGFLDPERARQELLCLANGPEDTPYTRDTAQQFAAVTPFLIEAMSKTPEPDTVLIRFGQILSQLPTPATLYNLLKYNTKVTHYLTTIISNSDYLPALLVRDISLLDLIGSPGYLEEASSIESLTAEFDILEHAADAAPALYRLRDGEMLKVALRELIMGISVAEVGDELTHLAEFIVEATLQRAHQTVSSRYGCSDIPFAAVALGKFGGNEIGYGSDLDLLFVYDETDENSQNMQVSPTEYFAAIASNVLKTLKEPSRYGILYDVDTRLRPDGSKGALAIPTQRFRQYYLEEAHFWERFALMKVRAVAGDPLFCSTIEGIAQDIAFGLVPDGDALDALESLRKKLAAGVPPHDLKRREGGIAEIEFATRLLQLQYVKQCPELKRGGVFAALDILSNHHFISTEDHDILHGGYTFYRKLLNRARMMRGSSSSKLPDAPETRRRLALCLDMNEDIMSEVEPWAAKIHALYCRIYEQLHTAAC